MWIQNQEKMEGIKFSTEDEFRKDLGLAGLPKRIETHLVAQSKSAEVCCLNKNAWIPYTCKKTFHHKDHTL